MLRSSLFAAGAALVLAGCTDRDLPDWMIGVFSSAQPGPSEHHGFQRFRIEEGGGLTLEFFSDYSVTDARQQRWEHGDAESITIFPGPDDTEDAQEHTTWTITRGGRCGPYTVEIYYDGFGPQGDYEIFRGELCSRPMTVPCNGECECCEFYWCEPPPPCG